jgi:hypothetical protein
MRRKKEADPYRDVTEGVWSMVLSSGRGDLVKKGWREKVSIFMSEPVDSFDYFEGKGRHGHFL